MAIDVTKPNRSQTIGDVIDSTRDNFDETQGHVDNATTAHGLAAILAAKTDYETTHKANTTTAHGLAAVLSQVETNRGEIATARGSKASLAARLTVSLQADGAIRLTSLASRWINNADTPTYISTTSFSIPGDRTAVYLAGVIIRATIPAGYVYGIVSSAVYAASVTTVSFDAAYPVLASGLSKVEIALLSFDNTLELAVATNAADILDLQSQISALELVAATKTKEIETDLTTGYTLAAADNDKVRTLTNGAAITLTVPSGLGAGFRCTIIQGGAGAVTPTAGAGVNIYQRQSLTVTAGQYARAELVAIAANTFILSGDLA